MTPRSTSTAQHSTAAEQLTFMREDYGDRLGIEGLKRPRNPPQPICQSSWGLKVLGPNLSSQHVGAHVDDDQPVPRLLSMPPCMFMHAQISQQSVGPMLEPHVVSFLKERLMVVFQEGLVVNAARLPDGDA
ncbi:MAG: hypothetical protein FRX49_02298 [Trebouxia sp. A1-2]|nr:MAG: hypothetical protein FRX49_02298 [Trebouxia sp. A1-2]